MTTKELNRDIKKLLKMKRTDGRGNATDEFYKEFRRLYGADNKFEYMNAESIKIMLRLNLTHQIIPLHIFGIFIDL